MEYMVGGDLKTFLRQHRLGAAEVLRAESAFVVRAASVLPLNGLERSSTPTITLQDLLEVAAQMARALAFLEERKVIHRDVAARNVFVGSSLARVKLGDFGLARDLYHSTDPVYLSKTEQRIPFKWMAPEAIRDLTHTTKSDVWSFGVLCFEITSLGMTPYGAQHTQDIVPFLMTGGRLAKPKPYCPHGLFSLMLDCWALDPAQRPSFADLQIRFRDLSESISRKELAAVIPAASATRDAPSAVLPRGVDTSPPASALTDTASPVSNPVLQSLKLSSPPVPTATSMADSSAGTTVSPTATYFTQPDVTLTEDGTRLRLRSVARSNPLFGAVATGGESFADEDADVETFL
jgi:serine/threonine protein kinase